MKSNGQIWKPRQAQWNIAFHLIESVKKLEWTK